MFKVQKMSLRHTYVNVYHTWKKDHGKNKYDKLQPRNIDIPFDNDSNLAIDIMVFICIVMS